MVLTDYEAALKHKYRVEPGGKFVPGVTTVIGIIDKPQLMWAASKIAAETMFDQLKGVQTWEVNRQELVNHCRGEFQRQWRSKADRGTRIHDIAERWTKGETVDVLPEDNGFIDALELFHKHYRPNFLMTERVVVNRWMEYGGRFDAICELDGPEDQGTFLIDYKSGGEYDYEVALQSAAYLACELATYHDDGTMGECEPLPKVDGARIIYLKEDGEIVVKDPFENVSQADAIVAFDASLKLYNIHKQISKQLKGGSNAE